MPDNCTFSLSEYQESVDQRFKQMRRPVPCGPDGEPLYNEYFSPGQRSREAEADVTLPQALTIGNDEQSFNCATMFSDVVKGGDQTLVADTFTEDYYFSDLELRDSQLNWLGQQTQAYFDTLLNTKYDPSNRTQSINDLRDYANLTEAQATQLHDDLDAIKALLNEAAWDYLTISATCYIGNESRESTCDAGYETQDTVTVVVGLDELQYSLFNEYPEDSSDDVDALYDDDYFQTIQDNLNTQALELSEAQKVCVYKNDEITVSCSSLEHDYAASLKGSDVVIASRAFESNISKDDANELATLSADAQLEGQCYWGHEETTKSCSDTYSDDGLIDQTAILAEDTFIIPFASYDAGVHDDPVVTINSWVDDLLDAQLNCEIGNAEQTVTCDSRDGLTPDEYISFIKDFDADTNSRFHGRVWSAAGTDPEEYSYTDDDDTYTIAENGTVWELKQGPTVLFERDSADALNTWDGTSWGLLYLGQIGTAYEGLELVFHQRHALSAEYDKSSLEVSIPANTFRAPVPVDVNDQDQDDLNTRAQELAQQSLKCVYCNEPLEGRCLQNQTLTPFPPVPYRSVCSYLSKEEAEDLALYMSATQADSDGDPGVAPCLYGNKVTAVWCHGDRPTALDTDLSNNYDIVDPTDGSCQLSVKVESDESTIYVTGSDSTEPSDILGAYSDSGDDLNGENIYRHDEASYSIWYDATNGWVITAEAQENNFSDGFISVNSSGAIDDYEGLTGGSYEDQSLSTIGGNEPSNAESYVVVPENTFTSAGSEGDDNPWDNVDALALAFAESTLICYWENPVIPINCETGLSGLADSLAAGTITSFKSLADAISTAQAIADAYCIDYGGGGFGTAVATAGCSDGTEPNLVLWNASDEEFTPLGCGTDCGEGAILQKNSEGQFVCTSTVPDGTATGDFLYWDNADFKWKLLSPGSTYHVLQKKADGSLGFDVVRFPS